jgi:hypothetical protein
LPQWPSGGPWSCRTSETAKDSVLFVILDLTFTSSGSTQHNSLGGDGTKLIQLLSACTFKHQSTPTSSYFRNYVISQPAIQDS